MATVNLDGITVRYREDGPPALDDLDLDVFDGELLVVTGPSGSGKTTLLRTIAGFEQPTSGRVLIEGEDVTDLPPGRRDLSMVFQEFALYSNLTAGKNIEFPLLARGVTSDDEREQRAHAQARSFRIEHLLERMPRQLSMGHRQAVATARAVVRTSRALLMDEPLANLDARSRDRARLEVRKMHEAVETTIVYVTNDQTEAMSIGSRLAVLDGGRIQQVAPPMTLFRHPVNTMVGGFIGTPSMRFLSGEIRRDGAASTLLIGTDRLPLGEDREDLDQWVGLPVTVGIRPGDLTVARAGTPFERCLHGRVTDVVDEGSSVFATVDLGRGSSPLLARLGPGDPHRSGSAIELTVEPGLVRLFDPATGEAIGS